MQWHRVPTRGTCCAHYPLQRFVTVSIACQCCLCFYFSGGAWCRHSQVSTPADAVHTLRCWSALLPSTMAATTLRFRFASYSVDATRRGRVFAPCARYAKSDSCGPRVELPLSKGSSRFSCKPLLCTPAAHRRQSQGAEAAPQLQSGSWACSDKGVRETDAWPHSTLLGLVCRAWCI